MQSYRRPSVWIALTEVYGRANCMLGRHRPSPAALKLQFRGATSYCAHCGKPMTWFQRDWYTG